MKKITLLRICLHSFFAIILLSNVLFFPHNSFAQTATSGAASSSDTKLTITLENPLGTTNTLPDFIVKVLKGVIELLTPVIVLMFLWTGFLFVKAQGKSEDLIAAKKSLMFTIIGAALILGASGLSRVLQATFTNL